jgi:putative hydrolase of the HAD superfamily
MAITTILFDLGKTLVDFDFEPINRRLTESSKLPAEVANQRTNDRYNAFCRGEISATEWQKFIETDYNLQMSTDEFRHFWADIFWPIEEMFELAHRTKRRYRQYLLSNTDEIHLPWCMKRYADRFEGLLDGMILSYEAGAIKPDRRIFEYGTERFNLIPEDCVFIDDLPENIEAAREFGFQGIVITSPEQVERDLQKLGVETT